jgi:small subunit ribosomal protein S26e
MCGQSVPRDKVKKVSRRVSLVDRTLARELTAKGAYISGQVQTKNYCISCAVHRGVVKVRSADQRRSRRRLR